ncbi:MAG: hypothetical protein KatS3mg052_0674 [Candidatus Roseilinea sp.]|nr:MAG: hypothetical protein KatS3mg052_0674 [Candidatus Roseilinea sp.]
MPATETEGISGADYNGQGVTPQVTCSLDNSRLAPVSA